MEKPTQAATTKKTDVSQKSSGKNSYDNKSSYEKETQKKKDKVLVTSRGRQTKKPQNRNEFIEDFESEIEEEEEESEEEVEDNKEGDEFESDYEAGIDHEELDDDYLNEADKDKDCLYYDKIRRNLLKNSQSNQGFDPQNFDIL